METTASLIIINGVDGYRTGIGLARKTIRHKPKKNCHYEKFVEFLNGSDGFVSSLVFSNLSLGSVRFYLNKIKDRAVWWGSKQFEDSYTLDILFPSNHNIHKSSVGLCFWASDPLIDRFE